MKYTGSHTEEVNVNKLYLWRQLQCTAEKEQLKSNKGIQMVKIITVPYWVVCKTPQHMKMVHTACSDMLNTPNLYKPSVLIPILPAFLNCDIEFNLSSCPSLNNALKVSKDAYTIVVSWNVIWKSCSVAFFWNAFLVLSSLLAWKTSWN